MTEFFLSPEFLNLLTLADLRFYFAIFISLLALWVLSSLKVEDPLFRSIVFRLGVFTLTLYFCLNVFLSQAVSSGVYRPILIGVDLAEEFKPFIDRGKIVTEKMIHAALFGGNGSGIVSGILVSFLLVGFGVFTFYKAPPRWIASGGIEILDAKIPNIVDVFILSHFIRSLFISTMLLFVTVVLFDLVQISAMTKPVENGAVLPDVFRERTFDRRFFVTLATAPLLLSWAAGTVLRTRYRMLYGDMHQYRPDKLVTFVRLARRKSGARFPEFGGRERLRRSDKK